MVRGIAIYQIFKKEKFIRCCTSKKGESIEDTKKRMIKDYKMSKDIDLFFVNYRK